jgi:DNA repair exonuclease SbcCD ATPase subunit
VAGKTGYAPSNYLQAQENQEELQAAKKARRDKMFGERNELRERVEQKRQRRKQLEEEVSSLEESNREKRVLLKKLANPTDNLDYVITNLITLTIELSMADKQQARYAELSSSLMMGLSSLKAQLNNDIKAGNPLEEEKRKFDDAVDVTIKAYTNSREKLAQLTRARKEFTPLLTQMRTTLSTE